MNARTYCYDPRAMWAYIQHGGSSTELYLHACDHLQTAEEAIEKTRKASYDCERPEEILRSPLEQVAPVLLDLCRRMPAGGFGVGPEAGRRVCRAD